MADYTDAARPIAELKPRHDIFVGIDSDGCAFDTMEIKHKECFAPNIIKHWGLQAISKYAREAAEFVNLYSKWRGINRWPALVMVFDLLRERTEVQTRGITPPAAPRIREFMASGLPLSNEGLAQYRADHPDPELDRALAWSKAVNASISDMVHGVPPFPWVRQSLAFLEDKADVIVVSATPQEALIREWEEHDIARLVRIIAGQEMGSKAEHLAAATKNKYAPGHVLMIGDAPGDYKAARANGALFFPVNPGHEDESWERFYKEAVPRFMAGDYAGEYEARLIAEFDKLLPEVPPWKKPQG
jgi:phosphoglycolate phosphatase-like HAD superfamily hydrolase